MAMPPSMAYNLGRAIGKNMDNVGEMLAVLFIALAAFIVGCMMGSSVGEAKVKTEWCKSLGKEYNSSAATCIDTPSAAPWQSK